MSLADLQTRVNTTALQRLGNQGATGTLLLNGVAVLGDFTNPYALGEMDGAAAEAREPQLTLLTGDVPANAHGMPVAADGKAYTVASVKPDGFGFTVLTLDAA